MGFSRDLRNTLRKLLVRQPEKVRGAPVRASEASLFCLLNNKRGGPSPLLPTHLPPSPSLYLPFHPQAYFVASVDVGAGEPTALLPLQKAWSAELGGPPPGNLPQTEAAWTGPFAVPGGAAAAAGYEAALRRALEVRGLREELALEPAELAQGKLEATASPRPQFPRAAMWLNVDGAARAALAARQAAARCAPGPLEGFASCLPSVPSARSLTPPLLFSPLSQPPRRKQPRGAGRGGRTRGQPAGLDRVVAGDAGQGGGGARRRPALARLRRAAAGTGQGRVGVRQERRALSRVLSF